VNKAFQLQYFSQIRKFDFAQQCPSIEFICRSINYYVSNLSWYWIDKDESRGRRRRLVAQCKKFNYCMLRSTVYYCMLRSTVSARKYTGYTLTRSNFGRENYSRANQD